MNCQSEFKMVAVMLALDYLNSHVKRAPSSGFEPEFQASEARVLSRLDYESSSRMTPREFKIRLGSAPDGIRTRITGSASPRTVQVILREHDSDITHLGLKELSLMMWTGIQYHLLERTSLSSFSICFDSNGFMR